MRAVVCMPWRGGQEWREYLFGLVKPHYEKMGFEVVTGDSDPDLPFNRSAARNAAAAAAGDADVYCFIDADTYIPEDQLRAAIQLAYNSGTAALAYNCIKAMNPLTGETLERVQPGQEVTFRTSGNIVIAKPLWK